MLKELFIKINYKKQDFTKEEQELLKPFLQENIVILNEGTYEVNSKYRIGLLEVGKNFAVISDLNNEHKNIKVDNSELHGAYSGDLVLAKRIFNPRVKFKAKIIKPLEGQDKELLVYTKNKELFTVKEQIHLKTKSIKEIISNYKDGDVLLVKSKNLEVLKSFGNLSDSKIDEKISVYLYDEQIRYEPEIDVKALMDDTNTRVDLRELAFCTIDPSSAKDHDDAIYYNEKERILFVAIADVSYFVKEDTILDKVAAKKAVSMYMPNRVLPMLPASLSEEMCSLKEHVDRYAYVLEIYLDDNFNVKKSKLYEAIINSHKKFAYEQIDLVLEKKQKIDKEFSYIDELYETTKKIRKKRLKKGYDFRTVEHRLSLNKEALLEKIVTEESTASHQLVEECMLLANIEASKKLQNLGIYRIHAEPSFQAISKLVDDVNILGIKAKVGSSVHDTILNIQNKVRDTSIEGEINELIIHAQTQAKYTSKNFGHFGLGFKSYSHFTSPIRRYSDLVLHRMLKTKKIPQNIDDICDYISKQERVVDQAVWNLEDRKYARWAMENQNIELKAQIIDEDRLIGKLYETMPGLRVHIDNYKGEKLFSKIKIIIKDVDIVSSKITASIKH